MTKRRTVLKVGLLGVAALAVGAGGGLGLLALRGTTMREPATPLKVLTPTEFSILAALAGRLFRGEGLPTAASLHVAEGVDATLSMLHPETLAEVQQVLNLIENALAGLALDGRVTTFTGSSPELQDQILRTWSASSWPMRRTAYRALHGLVLGVAWSHPELHGTIGYPGPPDLSALVPPADDALTDEVTP